MRELISKQRNARPQFFITQLAQIRDIDTGRGHHQNVVRQRGKVGPEMH